MTAVSSDIVATWTTTRGDRVEVYGSHFDGRPEWRFRVVARNGQIVETGSEGYTRRHRAVTAALRHHPRIEQT